MKSIKYTKNKFFQADNKSLAKIFSKRSLLLWALSCVLFLFQPVTQVSAQTSQFEITISIDYIEPGQEIYLSPDGETALLGTDFTRTRQT